MAILVYFLLALSISFASKPFLIGIVKRCKGLAYQLQTSGLLGEKEVPASAKDDTLQALKPTLQETLHALKRTTLTTRASKSGTATLRNLWRLSNPFVSDSYELQQTYKTALLRKFYKMDGQAWNAISQSVSKSLQPLIDQTEDNAGKPLLSLNLTEASLQTTLAAIFSELFDIHDVPTQRLHYIGTEIHRLTVAKKTFDSTIKNPDLLPQDIQRDADRLIQNLCDLFSQVKVPSALTQHILCTVSGTPESFNPLNLLIPAFEAPWRATLYTLLAVLQLGPTKPSALLALRDNPPQMSPSPAALSVVYESLRLYPPIRRVRRDSRVDIETIQRDPRYWGSDATSFNPSRFLTKEGKIDGSLIGPDSAWMPFAVGRMKCPSSGGYSARMVVVVVGEILRRLFPADSPLQWSLEGTEWDMSAKSGLPLRAGREEYQSVCVAVPAFSTEAV